MKTNILFLSSLLFALVSCNTSVKETAVDLTPKAITESDQFVIKRGVNLSHWLSQTPIRGEKREQYMQAEDFVAIAKAGYDHVRIPIEEEHMWDEQGNRHEDAFKLMHNGIKWSIENNLRVIIDLHIIRSHHFISKTNTLWTDTLAQQKFYGFWKELSAELIQYPTNMLAYELMNEAVAEDPDDWNNLMAEAIRVVRKKEPTRKIIMGSNLWQKVYTFKDLKVPENDTNIILSFHFYEPMLITHHTCSWSGLMHQYSEEVNYPGYTVDTAKYVNYSKALVAALEKENGYFDKKVLEEKIMLAVVVAEKYNLPLYCGEFGSSTSPSVEVRQRYYSDLMDIFNEHNIAWCHWNYKNNFPLFDEKTLEPLPEFQDIFMK